MKKIFTRLAFPILIAFSFAIPARAQNYEWRHMNSYLTSYAHLPGNPNVIFAGDQAGLIRKSTDQGATWKVVSTESENAIREIVFLDDARGFASANQQGLILTTQDGGYTWQRKLFTDTSNTFQALSSIIHRMVKVDDQPLFFDVYNYPISAPTPPKSIVTRDGGDTYSYLCEYACLGPGEAYSFIRY